MRWPARSTLLAVRQRQRRTWGEGTVYEFRPGAWLAQVRVGGRRLSATGPSATAAQQRLTAKVEAERRAAAGGVVEPVATVPTVGEYLTAWVEGLRTSRARKPSTWRRYESVVRLHLVPFLGARRLDELSTHDVLDLLGTARAGGTSGRRQGDTSLHHLHSVLRSGIQRAVDEGLLDRNVVRLVEAPPMRHRDRVILSAAQAGRLLRAARGARLEAAIVLGVCTGMREGEILGLRAADVDLAAGCLHVRKSAGRDYEGRPALDDPKTERSRRRIDLPQVAITALRAHMERDAPATLTLFPSARGSILSGTNFLRHHFHPVLRAARLPRMPFHDLRHSAATILQEMGVDEVTISEVLGHSTPAITTRLYGHATPRLRREAAARMDAALGAPPDRPRAGARRRPTGRLGGRLDSPPPGGPSWIPVADEPSIPGANGKQNGKQPVERQGSQGRKSKQDKDTAT
jgi:integrase